MDLGNFGHFQCWVRFLNRIESLGLISCATADYAYDIACMRREAMRIVK